MGCNVEFYLERGQENPEVAEKFLKGREPFLSHIHVGTIYCHLGGTGNILKLVMFLLPFSPPFCDAHSQR